MHAYPAPSCRREAAVAVFEAKVNTLFNSVFMMRRADGICIISHML
jgi:hypothetical protein